MKIWNEKSDEVSKGQKDKEKARALLKLINLREKNITKFDKRDSSTLIIEVYYEIIKELITAIMSVNGYKTTSHELLIGYLAEFHKDFSEFEINLIDNLRKIRNDIAYRGIIISPEYLDRNEKNLLKIIEKLKYLLNNKLK